MLRFYTYKGCESCRKARKWLSAKHISHQEIPIREQPPTLAELKLALEIQGNLKPLFNTSGIDYRQMNMKEKLPLLTDSQALSLLSNNGNLIKRPFLIDLANSTSLVGFKENIWEQVLNK